MALTLAGLVHEVNNLLTPVLLSAQVALRTPTKPELASKALQLTVERVTRATRVGQALLALARDGSGAARSSGDTAAAGPRADVALAVQSALHVATHTPAWSAISLEQRISPATTAAIGPTQLEHVLINLLTNAAKALARQPGPRRLTLEAHRECSSRNSSQTGWVDSAVGQVVISVQDNGPGIDPSVAARLGEPFATTASTPDQGSGVGLMLSKLLVEQAGGVLEVRSSPGQGTTCTVRLPEAAPLPAAQAA